MTDDSTTRKLPEAFVADDPGKDQDQDPGIFGAGRLVGSAVPETTQDKRREESSGDSETRVDEASEESFPGSDPPSFGRTKSS